MCDYRIESKRALDSLGVPLGRARRALSARAHNALLKAVREKRAWPGHDLQSGRRLPQDCIGRGYYMAPRVFEQFLLRLNARPNRCALCGGFLPRRLVRLHEVPGDNHRENIFHHFHEPCWTAWLLAVAVIFGHVAPEEFGKPAGRRKKSGRGNSLVMEVASSGYGAARPGRRRR